MTSLPQGCTASRVQISTQGCLPPKPGVLTIAPSSLFAKNLHCWLFLCCPAEPTQPWRLLCAKSKRLHSFLFLFLSFFRAKTMAYESSQAQGPIRAVASGLHHSHSNTRSEPHLQPTPQLTATPDPSPTERGQGSNPQPHGS